MPGYVVIVRRFKVYEALRSSLWFLPLLIALGSFGLWLLTSWADRVGDTDEWPLAFGGSPEGAQELLGAIVTSVITFTAVVFSITILALQLASQQFSPRLLRQFLRDRQTQVTLGLFIATLVYSVMVLREVRVGTDSQEPYVPSISVLVGLVILALAIGAFVNYLHHMAQSIRVVNIVQSVAIETRGALDKMLPDETDPPRQLVAEALPAPTQTLRAHQPGVVMAVTLDELAEHAARHDVVVEIVPAIGTFVPEDAPLIRVYGGELPERAAHTVAVGKERTLRQDPAFGFRQIVDVAVRALSPGINDPTTAVQCVDQLHDLLRRVVVRPDRSGEVCDDDGRARVLVRTPTWRDFLDLATEEILHFGGEQPPVRRRVDEMLRDLAAVAPVDRRLAIEATRRRLESSWERMGSAGAVPSGVSG
jgi:uncharacterized membrane protein